MLSPSLLDKVCEIVVAYASNNPLQPNEVSDLLKSVALQLEVLTGREDTDPSKPTPAVPIEKSFGDDFIICLEDGKRVTLLKRYLMKNFNLTPEDYIEKWGLPEDYPMVTKVYSEKRSKIAKAQGLGRSDQVRSSKRKSP